MIPIVRPNSLSEKNICASFGAILIAHFSAYGLALWNWLVIAPWNIDQPVDILAALEPARRLAILLSVSFLLGSVRSIRQPASFRAQFRVALFTLFFFLLLSVLVAVAAIVAVKLDLVGAAWSLPSPSGYAACRYASEAIHISAAPVALAALIFLRRS